MYKERNENVRNAKNCPQNVGYADKVKRKNEKRVIELMQKQETMIQKGEYNSPGDDTDDKKDKEAKENCLIQFTQEKMINMVKDKYDVGLIVNERSRTQSEKQNESSRLQNDTRAEGENIILSNQPEPMNEVQSTAAYNVFANDRQHAE
ncbi:hypothetical protein Tco_0587974 [Tanacetum coccineum]